MKYQQCDPVDSKSRLVPMVTRSESTPDLSGYASPYYYFEFCPFWTIIAVTMPSSPVVRRHGVSFFLLNPGVMPSSIYSDSSVESYALRM